MDDRHWCLASSALPTFCKDLWGGPPWVAIQAAVDTVGCSGSTPYRMGPCYYLKCPTSCDTGMYLAGACTGGTWPIDQLQYVSATAWWWMTPGCNVPDCTTCTNAPVNAHYTGFGAGPASNCPWVCNAGFTSIDGVSCSACAACPGGEYRTGCGGTSAGVCSVCGACPVGEYRTDCGGTSAGACSVCGACPEWQKRVDCSGVSPGTCCTLGLSEPIPCPPGTYGTGVGGTSASMCTVCNAGTYSTSLGLTASQS